MPSPVPIGQDAPVTALYGVGPERAFQLERLGIHTVRDLLLHRPRRYEDRRNVRTIHSLMAGEQALAWGKVIAKGVKWFAKRQKSVFEMVLDDGTAHLYCRWWNAPYLDGIFQRDDTLLVYGKLTSAKPRTMDHPENEIVEDGEERPIHMNRIVPIYPLTEGVPQKWLRSLIFRTVGVSQFLPTEPYPPEFAAPLPPVRDAVHWLHVPEDLNQPETARKRLALDEFLALQAEFRRRRKNLNSNARAFPCPHDNHLVRPYLKQLPFKLTESQAKVLREIRLNLAGEIPMRRLLQGDVGSGKTVVAACTALMVLESGHDVALMAPTQILAEQHFANFQNWFAELGVEVQIWTRSLKQSSLKHSGKPKRAGILYLGTHALITDRFLPENLGCVIIDEQHRFGVAEREQLVRKGHYPHLLVMTATPIPRSLALTLYGDLDLSIIEKPPANRGGIRTFVRSAGKLPEIWKFVRKELEAGRQAYIVQPRVENDDEPSIKAVTREYESLQAIFSPWKVGLIHGRVPRETRAQIMDQFRAGKLHVLLATTVIEVGVDVPNATVMVIENAEQFGLAQLHQLRGRIGRGEHASNCILVASARTEAAKLKLKALADSQDGFQIAEADLQLRGPGELIGSAQSGMPEFRFASLTNDFALLQQSRLLAEKLEAQALVEAKPKAVRRTPNAQA